MAGSEQTMLKRIRAEIQEDLLTLEDAALLVDPNSQIPRDTMDRVRKMVLTDPRAASHFVFLETLADEAEVPASGNRLQAVLRCLEDVERLVELEGWSHPDEVLDPTGEVGISYLELLHFVRILARQEPQELRYAAVGSKLERAWAMERAGNELVEHFTTRLCDHSPAAAERFLRRAVRKYGVRRQALESGKAAE